MKMNGEQTLVSIAIIGGIIVLFGSLGYACCYFKRRCKPLYAQESEIVHLRRGRKNSGLSASGLSEASTDSSASSYRKTLFQITYGEGTLEKPARAKRKSPLQSLSFIRKSKTFSDRFKSLTRKNSKNIPSVEEGKEEVNPFPNLDEN